MAKYDHNDKILPAQMRYWSSRPLNRDHCIRPILGMVFYEGRMFPDEFRGDAFVALHGSWNRTQRTGYKIIRIRFKNGKPVGGYDDFLTGWMLGPDRQEVWGRPVGLLVLPDGSMLIADDGANKIWRVTYKKK